MDRLIPWSRKRDKSTVFGAATVEDSNDSEEIKEQRQVQEPVRSTSIEEFLLFSWFRFCFKQAIVCQVVEVPLAVEDQAPPLKLPLDNIRTGVVLEGPHEGIPGFSRVSPQCSSTYIRTLKRIEGLWYAPATLPLVEATPSSDTIRQVVQVCDALKALHSSKIVHGHVGITNLLVSEKRALLYDFCKSRTGQAKGFEEDVFDFGITIAEILKGKRYSRQKIRLLRTYPRQPPWGSSIRASYGPAWDIATYCWSPNPSFRPTVPQVFESLSKSLGLVRVTEPPAPVPDAVLSDRPPLEEVRRSARTAPHPVTPPEPQTQVTTPNQLVHPPSVPSTPTPGRLMPAPEANEEWIECAPPECFNLPVRRYRRIRGIPPAPGGSSDVYKCETFYSDGSRQLVAEKVLRATSLRETGTRFFKCLQKFIQEVTIWGNLSHDRIAPLMGFTLQPSIALISPWYENGNVQQYLKSLEAQKQDCDRLKLLHEIAQGLTYLHEFTPPVVHGDIKPDNILIDDNGSALIIDFGLSRSVVESISGPISSNPVEGNVRWMAPELVKDGNLPKSLKADVYSFASLALNILTDAKPFKKFTTVTAVMVAICTESPTPSPAPARGRMSCKPALEDPLWKLLDECWTTNPAERPTMRDIEGRIQNLGTLDAALAEAHGVNNPPFPTGNEDKNVTAKEKRQSDPHDILPEMVTELQMKNLQLTSATHLG
ncbi:hypothetical protein FS837_001287 [Tulasnella sp. UAMH 9824]|nr:hypothetical protein FS837_001287 [Tulasnella sp. UAMH 9824]